MESIDLYLIHWPGVQGLKPSDERNRELRQQSWSDLEKLYEQGTYLTLAFIAANIVLTCIFVLCFLFDK